MAAFSLRTGRGRSGRRSRPTRSTAPRAQATSTRGRAPSPTAGRATAATRPSAATLAAASAPGLLQVEHAVLAGRDARRQAPPDHGHRAPGRPAGPGLLVVAHRDALGRGARPSCRAPRRCSSSPGCSRGGRPKRTLTFVSTSGGSAGPRARATSPAARRPPGGGARARRPRRDDAAPLRRWLVRRPTAWGRCGCAAPSRRRCARSRAATRAARGRRRSGRGSPSRSPTASRARSWTPASRPRSSRRRRARAARPARVCAGAPAGLRPRRPAHDHRARQRADAQRRPDRCRGHVAQGLALCGPYGSSSPRCCSPRCLSRVDGFARVRRRREAVGPGCAGSSRARRRSRSRWSSPGCWA